MVRWPAGEVQRNIALYRRMRDAPRDPQTCGFQEEAYSSTNKMSCPWAYRKVQDRSLPIMKVQNAA